VTALRPSEALAVALAAGREAADALRAGGGRIGEIRVKTSALDLVTEWDSRLEELLIERLRAAAPGVAFLGEETGAHGEERGARWIVDPIEGTVNFAHGLPLYGISIAYQADGLVQAGVVLAPAMGWEFAAVRGGGATRNGERLAVSTTDELKRALLVTGFPYDRATSPENNFREFVHLQRTAGAVRRLGAASLDLCFVASGWLDGYWEAKLKPWDAAAGALLVEEAGGRVTSREAGAFDLHRGEIVATNGRIHDALVHELAIAATRPQL
jgi:myo-inositol-1(or 4)-monophosphatase